MFKILWKLQKILDLGVVKILNMKWVISRQVSDSTPPQQGASEPYLADIFPWKVLKFLCKSLKSPWIFFKFECSGLESVFWCFLFV